MLLILVKGSEFEVVLNYPLSLRLGRKLSTATLFSIYFLGLYFPACVNHKLFKASYFYQNLLNTLLYSVVFVPTS